MMKVLITGATGFIGRALCRDWAGRIALRAAVRSPLPDDLAQLVEHCRVDLTGDQDWRQALQGIDIIVHCAIQGPQSGRKHTETHWQANVEGTLNLARQAAVAGVKRFVFLSSIKVNGELSPPQRPFCVDDIPAPQEEYGRIKWTIEQALHELTNNSDLEIVIVRIPLIYGPGVKGNFRLLMQGVARGLPLPFGAVHNRRSLMYIGNLADLLYRCLNHPQTVGKTLMAADGEDVSTMELIRRLALIMERRARLWPIPLSILDGIGRLTGQQDKMQRLCGTLQIDITETCRILDWQPPFSLDQGLRATLALEAAANS
jgi:nucleoside-diphosphate-sugar epimerase